MNIGSGQGGPSFEFNASGALTNIPWITKEWFPTLSISVKTPLGVPPDVQKILNQSLLRNSQAPSEPDASEENVKATAKPDASEENTDAIHINFDINTFGLLDHIGLRLRATGEFNGVETSGYIQPPSINGSWYFLGAELEAGYRKGDAEFKDVRTKAPDRGNILGRLGGVLELAPPLLFINRQHSRGLRFFIRGRGWADHFDDSKDPDESDFSSFRLSGFADSELFYNFSADKRVFVRGEYGSLPPDLTLVVNRVYVGVGSAF